MAQAPSTSRAAVLGSQSPVPPSHPSGSGGGKLWRLACRVRDSCRRSLQTDWHTNDEYDRSFWALAAFVYGSYAVKLWAKLTWQESAQNLGMMCGVLLLALFSSLRPAAYRRHGALLRMGLLTYGYTMPVLTSTQAMHAFTPAPSTVPVLGGLVDTYSLWLSTRNAFLAWAVVGCRPPLYLAVPYQLMGLWRITAADFCAAPVLKHPVMQQRTELAHTLLGFLVVGMGGSITWTHLLPSSPEKRCASLLLFYNALFAFLAPLLLLVPLKRQRRATPVHGAGGGRAPAPPAPAFLQRVEAGLERVLRTLMLPQHAGHGQQAQHHDVGGHRTPLVLRWWTVLAVLWTLCCILCS